MLRSAFRCNSLLAQGVVLPQRRLASALVQKFESAVDSLPHREAVRYVEKNYKWTISQLNNYVNAHANALLEHGVKPGDTLAVWLPDNAEKHVILLAAAKAGFKVADLDLSLTSVTDVREMLSAAQPKVLYFHTQLGETDYVKLLRKSIPEFFYYDDSAGQMFHSKYYPALRYFVQMGMDNEVGVLNFKELFLLDPPTSYVEEASKHVKDDTPLYVQVKKEGGKVQASKVVTHAQASSAASFAFAQKIASGQYFEI